MIKPTIAYASQRRRPFVVGLALLGTLLIGACNNEPSPSPSPIASASAFPSSPASPSIGAPSASSEVACTASDVQATGGPWGGAAGSRGSDVVVQSVAGGPCLVPAGPAVALVDAGGAVLLSTQPRAGSGPSLAPGGTLGFSVLLGNWCAQGIQLPLHLRLALAGDVVDIANLVVSSPDDLPPCNGPGLPASLSVSDWQP